MAISANLCESMVAGERRRARRHRLLLDATAQTPDAAAVIVHDLSQTGFLMETIAPCALGEIVELRVRELNAVTARVVWTCGRYVGCEFRRPVTRAAVSAALLQGRPVRALGQLPAGRRLDRSRILDEATPVESRMSARARFGLIVAASAASWSAVVAATLAA